MTKPLSDFTSVALDEGTGAQDPPMMLVLRRKAIRQFPGEQRVALYVNDQLGIEISVPYKKGQIGGQKAVASIKESAHDNLYGEYLHHLGKGDHRAADHIALKVERDYGVSAGKHFRTAAKLHSTGDVTAAGHHYSKFEHEMREHVESMDSNLDEHVLHKLRHIARSKQFGDVSFKKDGGASRVDPKDATKVLKFWGVADKGNRRKIEKMINKGHGGITSVAKFVDDHMKITKPKKGKK